MKRSPMPPRRQQMKRTGPPNRKHPPRKKSLRKPAPDSGFWQEQRTVIYLRSRGWCEVCGCDISTGFEAHHRKLRSQGGGHGVENLLALCHGCHHDRVHAHPVEARERGWIVPSGGDPAARAVLLWDGRTVRLTVDGRYDEIFPARGEAS